MLKVGLVGYGFMGHMHAQCYGATGEAQVIALADVDPKKREEGQGKGWQVFESIDEMLAAVELDIVDVCTPTYLHEEHVVAAAQKVKNIMCEKPMARTVESCDRMIAAVEGKGIKLMFGQVIRFWPEYQVIKEILDSGKYGKLLWVSAQRRSAFPGAAWENWFADPVKSGGAVLDLHIHDQDYINFLLGMPKSVDARGTLGTGGGLNSVTALGWGYENGASTYAEASFDLAPTFPFNMSILVSFEKATVKYDMAATPGLMVYPMEGEPYSPELPEGKVGASTETSGNISDLGGYYNELKYFVNCILSGKMPEIVTPQDARNAVKICLALTESFETGKAVDL